MKEFNEHKRNSNCTLDKYSSLHDILRINGDELSKQFINILRIYAYLANALDTYDFLYISIRTLAKELNIGRTAIHRIVEWLIRCQEIERHKDNHQLYKLT